MNTTKTRQISWRRLTALAVVMGVIIFGVTLALGSWWAAPPSGDVDLSDPDGTPSEPPEPQVPEPKLVLILGVDSRAGDRGRSDTMLVAGVDPGRHMGILSLPRDTWAEIPGRGYTKLNHAYAFGGPELALETVSHLLDLPIEHYVVIDFKGFEQIIDAIGGVELDVEKSLYYRDPYQDLLIDLQPGRQVLNGKKALDYARFRSDAEADIGRIKRQQRLIEALIDSMFTAKNIIKAPQLVKALFDAVDTNVGLKDSLQYANAARNWQRVPLQSGMLSGKNTSVGGLSYIVPDLVAGRAEAHRVLLGREPAPEVERKAAADEQQMQAALASAREQARRTDEQRQTETPDPNSNPDPNPNQGDRDDPAESKPDDPSPDGGETPPVDDPVQPEPPVGDDEPEQPEPPAEPPADAADPVDPGDENDPADDGGEVEPPWPGEWPDPADPPVGEDLG